MKILIEGAQGTGKNTLIEALKLEVPTLNYVLPLRIQGHIRKVSDDVSQMLLITDYTIQMLSNKVGVWNRGFLSGLAMTRWLTEEGKLSEDVLDFYETLVQERLEFFGYDLVFILEPWSKDVPDDNRRDTDQAVRDIIQQYILNYAERLKIPYTLVPATPVSERLQFVMDKIQEKLYTDSPIQDVEIQLVTK